MSNLDDKLGLQAEDKITEFKGTVTGYASYISGCSQVLLAPKTDGGKFVESQWFDEQRLKYDTRNERVVLDNSKTPGPDRMAPKR